MGNTSQPGKCEQGSPRAPWSRMHVLLAGLCLVTLSKVLAGNLQWLQAPEMPVLVAGVAALTSKTSSLEGSNRQIMSETGDEARWLVPEADREIMGVSVIGQLAKDQSQRTDQSQAKDLQAENLQAKDHSQGKDWSLGKDQSQDSAKWPPLRLLPLKTLQALEASKSLLNTELRSLAGQGGGLSAPEHSRKVQETSLTGLWPTLAPPALLSAKGGGGGGLGGEGDVGESINDRKQGRKEREKGGGQRHKSGDGLAQGSLARGIDNGAKHVPEVPGAPGALKPDCKALRKTIAKLLKRSARYRTSTTQHLSTLSVSGGYQRQPGQCWSRAEWECFQGANRHLAPASPLKRALQQYEDHWHECRHKEPNEEVRRKLRAGQPTLCRYILWSPMDTGLGNLMLGFISTFAYALLTSRVLLVEPSPHSLAHLFCDPFPGVANHSWLFPHVQDFGGQLFWETKAPTPYSYRKNQEFRMDRPAPHVLSFHVSHRDPQHPKFYCPEFHHWAMRAHALVATSSLFWTPALYFVPEFQEKLRTLFPKGKVFTSLSRQLLFPSNGVWIQVTSKFIQGLSVDKPKKLPAGRGGENPKVKELRVGVQYRSGFGLPPLHAALATVNCVAKHLPQFKSRNARIPATPPGRTSQGTVSRGANAGSGAMEGALQSQVLVLSSLDTTFMQVMAKLWMDFSLGNASFPAQGNASLGAQEPHPSRRALRSSIDPTIKSIKSIKASTSQQPGSETSAISIQSLPPAPPLVTRRVLSLTKDKREVRRNLFHNARALVDILCLGLMSNVLLITPRSTFGYCALAFSKAKPMFIAEPCKQASWEPCLLYRPPGVTCQAGKVTFPPPVLVEEEGTRLARGQRIGVRSCQDAVWIQRYSRWSMNPGLAVVP